MIDKPIYDTDYIEIRYVHLDVGNVMHKKGEEIVVGNQSYDELTYYYWDGKELIEGTRYPLEKSTSVTNVFISELNKKPDYLADVIVCGRTTPEENQGRFYLELFGFNNGFFSKWKRIGGDKVDRTVSYAAFGKKRE